jgi:hypothetical protein
VETSTMPATPDSTAKGKGEVGRTSCRSETTTPDSVRHSAGPQGRPAQPRAGSQECAEERARVLALTPIGSIPMLTELTALYIGIFAATMTALALVALKELAREALALSEQELMLRAWSPVSASSEAHPFKSGEG